MPDMRGIAPLPESPHGLSAFIGNDFDIGKIMARISPATPEQFAQVADHMERWRKTKGYPLYTPADRAALELAAAAGACPPRVTDAHFVDLKKHYSEDAATEIVAVIALLGWLNRWNITLATRIEDEALAFARKHLAGSGWTPGAHADTIGAK
jgi:hypothetical protein